MQKIKTYIKTHLWCALAGAIIGFILLFMGLLQTYLKQEYAKYLKNQTYDKEGVMISSVSSNLKVILKDFIQIGSEVATDLELSQSIQKYVNEPDNREVNRRILRDNLKGYIYYSKWIEGICIVSEDGLLYQFDRMDNTDQKLWDKDNNNDLIKLRKEVLTLIKGNNIPRYAVSSTPHYHPNDKNKELFHLAYPIREGTNYGTANYCVVISFNQGVIGEFLDTINRNNPNVEAAYITDVNGEIIYHQEKELIGVNIDIYLKKRNLYNFSNPIGKLNWDLNVSVDEKALLQQVNDIYNKGIIFYVALTLILSVILIVVINGILKPVREIAKSIKKVKKGNLQAQIPIKGYHEIWQLAEEYNKMIKALVIMNQQMEQHHEEKLLFMKKKQKAEREALESQINAHFICNTLGVINYEAIESGNHKVSILIKKLSNILRYTFNQKNQNVYLYQEAAWIEQYLYLQKSRLDDSMEYSIFISQEVESWPCRKLMLQPFVENSILHGFEGMEEGGKLTITATLEKDRLKLIIEDNGTGISSERAEMIRNIIMNPMEIDKTNFGIGISNVITRMKMYYGDTLKVFLETEEGKGTKFIFYMPQPIESK